MPPRNTPRSGPTARRQSNRRVRGVVHQFLSGQNSKSPGHGCAGHGHLPGDLARMGRRLRFLDQQDGLKVILLALAQSRVLFGVDRHI